MGILRLKKGSHVLYGEKQVLVVSRPSPLSVRIRFEDGLVTEVDPQTLTTADITPGRPARHIHTTDEKIMAEAQRRYRIIQPLMQLSGGDRTRKLVEARALESRDVHFPKLCAETLYTWIRHYEASGELLSLVRVRRSDKGGTHLPVLTARLMDEHIGAYLPQRRQAGNRTQRRLIFKELMVSFREACQNAGLQVPHANTVRNALNRLEPLELAKARGSRKGVARHEALPGHYEGGDAPLAVAQIDHTLLDIVVVDDDGEPIGRPWLTLLIDVYSRMVLGINISMYAPGAHTSLQSVAQAILPKNDWLLSHGLDPERFPWPVFGKMRVIHSDNGKDFDSNSMCRSLNAHGIDHHFRMVGKPNWGSYIEALMGTVGDEMEALLGYTGPNTVKRSDLKLYAERDAILTMKALHARLLHWVLNTYHKRWHTGLKGIPQDAYVRGLMSKTALPELIVGPEARRLRIDFLPFFKAAVTPKGAVFNYIQYYDHALDRYVGVKEHAQSNRTKEQVFQYDPHDLSTVYFFEETQNEYLSVPYADLRRPSVTLWEVRRALQKLNDERRDKVDSDALFKAVLEGRRMLKEAATQTRGAKVARKALAQQQESAERAARSVQLNGGPTETTPLPPEESAAADIPADSSSATAPPVRETKPVPVFPLRSRGIRA